MKKVRKKVQTNKLLKHLGGKFVSVVLKENSSLGGNPIIKNVLLDSDENFYYLGESIEVQVAIPMSEVMMITDADIPEVEEKKPFGDPFQ
jgi:hypothetical protein